MGDDLRSMLVRHEGNRRWLYFDKCGHRVQDCDCPREKRGKLTGGVGHNYEANPLSDTIIQIQLDEDISRVSQEVRKTFPWAIGLDPVRAAALLDMCFNFGTTKVSTFVKFLGALYESNWILAVSELADIHFASEGRRREIAHMILTGEEV